MTNCINCSAPIKIDLGKCIYCDTEYQKKEVKQELKILRGDMMSLNRIENVHLIGKMNTVKVAINCIIEGKMNTIRYAKDCVIRGKMNTVDRSDNCRASGKMNTLRNT